MRKKLVIILGCVALLLVAAMGFVVSNLDSVIASLQPRILATLSETLRRPVVIQNISASIFPRARVVLSQLALTETNAEPALKAEEVALQAELGALVRGNLRVRTFTVRDAAANITREKDGTILLGSLPIAPKKAEAEARSKLQGKESGGEASPDKKAVAFEVESADVENLSLKLHDRQTEPPAEIALDVAKLEASNLGANTDAKFSLEGRLLSGKSSNLRASGVVNPSGSTLSIDLSLQELDVAKAFDLLRRYSKSPVQGVASGTGSIELHAEGSQKDSLVLTPSVDLTPAALSYRDKEKEIFSKGAGYPLTLLGKAVVRPKAKIVENADFDIKLGKSSGKTQVKQSSPTAFDLTLKEVSADLADLGTVLPALSELQPNGAAHADLVLRVDNHALQEVNGTVELKGGAFSLPFPLSEINGRILCSGKEIASDKLTLRAGPKEGAEEIEASMKVVLETDAVKILPSTIRGLGGAVALNGAMSTGPAKNVAAEISAQNLDLAKVFAAMGKEAAILGTLAEAGAKLRGTRENLSGPARVKIVKGSIPGVNIAAEALQGVTAIPGVSESLVKYAGTEGQAALSRGETQFDELTAEMNMDAGSVDLSSIALSHPVYSLTGSGRIERSGNANIKLQLALSARITESMITRQEKLKFLVGPEGVIAFPVVVKREGTRTMVLPDVSGLLKNAARSVAKDKAGEVLEKLSPRIGGDAKQLLDSLLK